jgi:hypothetical protein
VTLYDTLGVEPTASDQEIRKVYVDLARRHHPDFHTDAEPEARAAADRRMQQINEAWAVLGDPDRRATYDLGLRGGTSSSAVSSAPKREWRPVEPDDPNEIEVDPRDLIDDVPIVADAKPPRSLPFFVALFFVGALVLLSAGLVTRVPAILALGAILLGLTIVALVAAPLVVMAKSWRGDEG